MFRFWDLGLMVGMREFLQIDLEIHGLRFAGSPGFRVGTN